MKKLILFLSIIQLLIMSCVTTQLETSMVPIFYTFDGNKEFVILGEVIFETVERAGYVELLRETKKIYPNCDYVIDIMVDRRTITARSTELTSGSTSVNSVVIWIMRGLAVQFVQNDSNQHIQSTTINDVTLTTRNSGQTQSQNQRNEVIFPSEFIGTWKRDNFDNTLTFSESSVQSSSQSNPMILTRVSSDSYTLFNNNNQYSYTITIKLVDENIEISGGTGSGQGNWNGVWKKQ